jgi:hypothetical protein
MTGGAAPPPTAGQAYSGSQPGPAQPAGLAALLVADRRIPLDAVMVTREVTDAQPAQPARRSLA